MFPQRALWNAKVTQIRIARFAFGLRSSVEGADDRSSTEAWRLMFGLLALSSGGGGKCKPIDDEQHEDVNRLGTFIKKALENEPPDYDPDYFVPFTNPLAHVGDPRRKCCVKRLSVAQRNAIEIAEAEINAARALAKERSRLARQRAQDQVALEHASRRPVKNLSQFVKEETIARRRAAAPPSLPLPQPPSYALHVQQHLAPHGPAAASPHEESCDAPAEAARNDSTIGFLETAWSHTASWIGMKPPPVHSASPVVPTSSSFRPAQGCAVPSTPAPRGPSQSSTPAHADRPLKAPASALEGSAHHKTSMRIMGRSATTTPRKQRPDAAALTPRLPARTGATEDAAGGWFSSWFAPKPKETPEKLKDKFFSPRGW